MSEAKESPPQVKSVTVKPAEERESSSGESPEARLCHLAQALTMAGELARRLAEEKGQAQLAAQAGELEAQLRLAWGEQIALSLKALELGALNLKYKQQVRLGREVIYDVGFYWLGGSGRTKIDGPLCPSCWEVEDKLVHLSRVSLEPARVAEPGEWRQWECRRCHEVFLRKEGPAAAGEPLARSEDAQARQ